MNAQINATVAGVPRIGPKRELKKALETYWKDATTGRNLATVATQLVNQQADRLTGEGLDSVPTIGRSFYDSMLDTSALLGALPARVADIDDHGNDGLPAFVDRLFAAARGTAELPASAMTKWFDTNYHYIVPELAADTEFRLDDAALLADLGDQLTRGTAARPVLIGPLTYLALARTTDGSDALTHLEEVFEAYARLLPRIAERGADWVQFDEPYLVTDVDKDSDRKADLLARTRAGYEKLAAATDLNLLVQTYFGDGDLAIKTLTGTGIAAFGVDLVTGRTDERQSDETNIADADLLPSWNGSEQLLAGVVDGRNIWRTDLARALETLKALAARGPVGVSTSSSLLHVPYSLAQETSLDDDSELRGWLAFGAEKVAEVAVLSRALRGEEKEGDAEAVAEAEAAVSSRKNSERTRNAALRERTGAITEADRHRNPFDQRREVQERELDLPPLPTTTIGSFPQTAEIRAARAKLRTGEFSDAQYHDAMVAEIKDVIERQEALGLDVLVHGEPERNDMVQYFSEQLEGYHSTDLAWVQSYGSRCVRPPILFGDVTRPKAMTVEWFKTAQSFTDKIVKGMLTGPVTMLAWAFVRDDQPLGETADQVALALRDEIDDLVDAGAKIVQVDEAALRELLPLRAAQQPYYLQWSVGSFRLATAGVEDVTQIHTHMCYSEFNELIGTIADLDGDVTSIEASRNGMQVLHALKDSGFELAVGPGVWDIHSPRVPDQAEVDKQLADAVEAVPARQLWVNPDCGLKTRGWEETTAALKVLVAAAEKARATVNA
ncbi:MAG: 5-methyltetrahydropteroyltriglutamate--homocysteine S-methyltransferase [Candidatus Corynebacterium faecigallinarum]|uniref:5-methyltetrahydropteroyltriglutamate-- homocysteine S-methyltransferase n=2 Tax=Corynebacteriaceae TaxID=1653 RepID=UPI002647A4FB|nr:5-methyltetrahydropteroyltriglutamate--homocysteine S-methyltransferase [Corynebacterium sp.]MDN5721894.1 5-methyltetrahydropteroyltriglutamate--homocysteine S-methyltransferase [Corynebacterium sp.]MDN6282130.1 5-methyltetrahydropteroyltriglutamate--homocysteine S-methyltransferase [Corynebacterium sp.]MDN6351790.1 5-methyltetrahydropteroyltriglutamate--homocysteine S-methyltransferase [Corynebacterium sp.]MDN6366526.1 5-methyltetrahydropteroyltriglutamate--homocysteine S-methyltransferase 